jgi:hypothetical protein
MRGFSKKELQMVITMAPNSDECRQDQALHLQQQDVHPRL